jgi:ABC-2 type transport system ATP-binding protein
MREVGALLDAGALHGGRRACDHLLCLAQSNGIPRSRVDEVLRIVGLEGVARRRAKGLSLGMGQRLGIASALLGNPAVLVFDEPVNGLDPDGIYWVRTLMRALAAEGRTVLVSSHLMSEMALTADHLLVIGKGRLIAVARNPWKVVQRSPVQSDRARPARAVVSGLYRFRTRHSGFERLPVLTGGCGAAMRRVVRGLPGRAARCGGHR